MCKPNLTAIMFLLSTVSYSGVQSHSGSKYFGPECLGPYCLNRVVSTVSLAKTLGPASTDSAPYTYKSNGLFLVVRNKEASEAVGAIALGNRPWQTASPNIEDYDVTKENLRAWKTPEGIRLGSLESEVIAAYGKSSGEHDFVAEHHGVVEVEKEFVYKGAFAMEIAEAVFGVRNGKVTSIQLETTSYAGPDCLGPFCIGFDIPENSAPSIFEQLGASKTRISGPLSYCYQSRGKSSFIRVDTDGEHPPAAVTVVLSDFPNCTKRSVKVTATEFGQWETPEGISLGSRVEEVLHAYGKPTEEVKPNPPFVILGYAGKEPDVGSEELDYASHGLIRTSFGIRKGRVSFIYLSYSE
jgi:hypothetical protein